MTAIRITTLVEAGELTGYYCQVKRELDGEERYLITNESTYTVHACSYAIVTMMNMYQSKGVDNGG